MQTYVQGTYDFIGYRLRGTLAGAPYLDPRTERIQALIPKVVYKEVEERDQKQRQAND